MGLLQNLRLWENNVTRINDDGETTTETVPRRVPPAPWKLLASPGLKGWMYFVLGLAAWTADGYDFNAVNLVSTSLAKHYGRSVSEISLSITLTLLFRSLGAAVIGLAADRYGRKWPLFLDLVVLCALQIATAYAGSFGAFIGVRALFGIFMGGIWGLAAALSLENIPTDARGLFSGVLQQGYSLGYLIAAGINLRAGTNTVLGYRLVFIVGSGLTGLIAIATLFVPESAQYRGRAPSTRAFTTDLKLAARQYWRTFSYCILLSASFNWMSHGSQDVYPNFLKIQKNLGNYNASVATMLGQTGAVVGGFITGFYSQFFGRRLTIVAACCFGLVMIPLWTLPNTFAPLAVGEFLLQSAQNGAWGCMPVLLNEYAPPQFRGVFPGTVYQLGNMLSAPAAEIQTVSASAWIENGKPNYSQVMTIVMCIVFSTTAILTACGQERLGSRFDLVERAGAVSNIEREQLELKTPWDEEAGHCDSKAASSSQRVEILDDPRSRSESARMADQQGHMASGGTVLLATQVRNGKGSTSGDVL